MKEKLGKLPGNFIADTGYGSEENYEYLNDENVNAYVKHRRFHWEKLKKNRDNIFLTDNLKYDEGSDS